MIQRLKDNNIRRIAREATGSYWQALFSALQESGFEVALVDGKQTKGQIRLRNSRATPREISALQTL